jgi:hypothetical protein
MGWGASGRSTLSGFAHVPPKELACDAEPPPPLLLGAAETEVNAKTTIMNMANQRFLFIVLLLECECVLKKSDRHKAEQVLFFLNNKSLLIFWQNVQPKKTRLCSHQGSFPAIPLLIRQTSIHKILLRQDPKYRNHLNNLNFTRLSKIGYHPFFRYTGALQ